LDKIVNGCFSKRRSDLLLDLGYQILIVEVDENQHIDYDCSCENKRNMELSQDMGHRPIVFIRFNPDEYEKDGENITSCCGNNEKGICQVKNSKKSEWEERLLVLAQHIDNWINPENITNKIIESFQLYYDIGEVKSTSTFKRDQKHHNIKTLKKIKLN
jgi:predicted acylesterase/phospholipase RssA